MAYAKEYQGAIILPQYSEMNEMWYDLPDTHNLAGRFKVSNLGNVAEIGRDGRLYLKHQLTHKKDNDRTITVKGKAYRVGVMVALAILGPSLTSPIHPDDAIVVYKDKNKLNNNINNLELGKKEYDYAVILPQYANEPEYWVDMSEDHPFHGKIKASNKGNIADILPNGNLKIKHQGRKSANSKVRRVSLGNAMYLSHKIIADAFLLNDYPESERSGAWFIIDHIDKNPENNNVKNLKVIRKEIKYAKVLEKYTDAEVYREFFETHPLYRKALVSSHGNVKRIEHNGDLTLLNQTTDTDGFRNVFVNRDLWKVHRLVCAVFNGIPPTDGVSLSYNQKDGIGSMVEHIDSDLENNHYSNLRWFNTGEDTALVLEKYNDPEIWRELPPGHRFYGKVKISSHGNVQKYSDFGTCTLMHQPTNSAGYRHVSIDGNEIMTHRLVAAAFIMVPVYLKASPMYNQLDGIPYIVNHKDANKINNHYTNLEWVNNEMNLAHARDMGLTRDSIPVTAIDTITGSVYEFRSIAEASRGLNAGYSKIVRALSLSHSKLLDDRYQIKLVDTSILDDLKPGRSIGAEYRDYMKNQVVLSNSITQASYTSGVEKFIISQYLTDPELKNQLIGGIVFRSESEIGKPWPEYTEEQIKDSYKDYFSG